MKNIKDVILFLLGCFLAWCIGVCAGGAYAADHPDWRENVKKNWDSFGSNKFEKRSKRKHEKYATLNEVLRGRDEFYEETE